MSGLRNAAYPRSGAIRAFLQCSTYAARALLTNLEIGTKYYYVCGSENSTLPWSQVFSFTFGSGFVRPDGPVYAVLADFGYYNAESLEKLMASAFAGDFDVLLHAGEEY